MDVQQMRPGVLGDGQPGQKVREQLQKLGGDSGAAQQLAGEGGLSEKLQVPDEPGPALAGKTPLVGTLRRSKDLPVVRDKLGGS